MRKGSICWIKMGCNYSYKNKKKGIESQYKYQNGQGMKKKINNFGSSMSQGDFWHLKWYFLNFG